MPNLNQSQDGPASGSPRKSDAPQSTWLDRKANHARSHFARRPSQKEAERDRVLKAWFGPLRSTGEISSLRSPPRSIDEVLDVVVKGLGIGAAEMVGRIRTKWSETVGRDIAGNTEPIACRNGVLVVEVSNATWQFVLMHERKGQVLAHIRAAGFDGVRDIQFVPKGRYQQ